MEFQPVHRLIDATAKKLSSAIAARYGEHTLTYQDLMDRSNRVARLLRTQEIKRGDLIAVCLDSPLDQLIAILGVSMNNCAWVPLRSSLPVARAASILSHSRARALIQSAEAAPLPFDGCRLLLDDLGERGESDDVPAGGEDAAAIIYVSKESGRPEGLVFSHANLANAVTFIGDRLKINVEKLLCVGDWLDEASLAVVLAALSQGGTVCFASARMDDGDGLREQIRGAQARSLTLPLATLAAGYEQSVDLGLDQVDNVVTFGNDLIPCEVLKQYLKDTNTIWHNFYGFPEIQFVTNVRAEGSGADIRVAHVGRPAAQTQAFILDSAQQLVSVGLTGDLYASGSGVFAGFLRNDALSAAHFGENPFKEGEQLYRTGCLARWLSNGRIEIVGRADQEVSIHGQRMALPEIEAALVDHPSVLDCAVVQHRSAAGEMCVTAFVVTPEDLEYLGLEAYLAERLGQFSVGLIQLNRLPRRVDGEVDRPALSKLTLLDSAQIRRLEQTLRALGDSDDLAVVVHHPAPPALPLHADEVLPQRSRPPAQSEAPAAHVETLADSRPLAIAFGAELREKHNPPLTLVEALLIAAERYPTHGVYYVQPDSSAILQTYPELVEDAARILRGLRAAGVEPGNQLLFQFNHNEDFIPAFWACMLGGFVPVPLSIPPRYEPANAVVAKLHNAWATLGHPTLLTCRELAQPIRAVFADLGSEQAEILDIEALRDHPADRAWHPASPGDTALLLLTSGSTGMPKGVVLAHCNIIARSKATIQHNGFSSDDISFNWMPLDHVGGIVMYHICDVCLCARQFHARTEDILVNPVGWLDLIEKYRINNTWAPNFAFALINDNHERVNAIERDLSSLRFILNGGEAIQAKTAQAFLRLLRPHGLPPTAMHPAYGMSETCSGITFSSVFALDSQEGIHELDQASLKGAVRKADAQSIAVSFVEVGAPIPGVGIRIVNGQNQTLPVGVVGRLQVSGPTVTHGYYKNPALNREVFTEDGWFTTGDLAFLLDGRLTIAGREKDIIIINGVNYHCHEIEEIVESVEGVEVSYTAACALRGTSGGTEEMALFYNSKYDDLARQIAQIEAIRQAVVQKIGVNPTYVIPVPKEAIPKTGIGKIQRTQLGQEFAEGKYADIVRAIDLGTANERTIPNWFFAKVWEAQAPPPGRVATGREYVVVGADTPLSGALIGALEARGSRCVRVVPGPAFARLDERSYTLDPGDSAGYRRLQASLSADGIGARDYIHLAGYGPYTGPVASLDALRAAQESGVYSVLALVQALAHTSAEPATLTVVTSYSQAIRPADPVAYERSTLIGLLKTIGLELEWLTYRHLDLEADDVAVASAQIVRELSVPRGNPEVAYRERQRLVPRLARADFQSPPQDPFVQHGIYLITGGLGGVGAHLARWLSKTYQARLVLVGSTRLPEQAAGDGALGQRAAKRLQTYQDLKSSGAEFIYEALDIDDPDQIRAAIERAEARWNAPLAGVFHFAGEGNLNYHWTVMDQHKVTVERRETFEMMFMPKVYGTWALQQAIKDRPDILFIAASSVAGFFGGATFCAYSAANSFVDNFALHQRAHTHPRTFCLSWSQWNNVGMSHNNPATLQELSRARGYQAIGISQGINSLLAAVAHDHGHLFVGLDSGSRLMRSVIATSDDTPLIRIYYSTQTVALSRERIAQIVGQHYGEQPVEICPVEELPRDASGAIDIARLEQATLAERHEKEPDQIVNDIERQLIVIWQEVLGRSKFGLYDNFFALGGHSLLATQVISRLRETFNLELRLHQLFEAPTIAELAATIAQMQLETVDDGAAEQLFAELEGLSDEDIARLLKD